MSGRAKFSTAATVGASLLLPAAALAFNPQPDPPGKWQKQTHSLGGPDTKGSWKRVHEVDEKSKSKRGSWKRYHEVDKGK